MRLKQRNVSKSIGIPIESNNLLLKCLAVIGLGVITYSISVLRDGLLD